MRQAFWAVTDAQLHALLCRGIPRDALRLRRKLTAKGRVVQVLPGWACPAVSCSCSARLECTHGGGHRARGAASGRPVLARAVVAATGAPSLRREWMGQWLLGPAADVGPRSHRRQWLGHGVGCTMDGASLSLACLAHGVAAPGTSAAIALLSLHAGNPPWGKGWACPARLGLSCPAGPVLPG
jgi:hypothetical protein